MHSLHHSNPRQFHFNTSYNPQNDIRIALTSFYGDAELFVSTQLTTNYNNSGTRANFTWRSYDAGTSVIIIAGNDPALTCTTPGSFCDLYVTVWPHDEPSYYHLVVTHNTQRSIFIRNSEAINFASSAMTNVSFIYIPEQWELNQEIRITTTPSYGAAYIYVNNAAFNSSPPTPFNYQCAGYGDYNGVFVHIRPSSPCYCASSTFCAYSITVSTLSPNYTSGQFYEATQYTLLLNVVVPDAQTSPMIPSFWDANTRLVNHVPFIRGIVAGDMEYFRFSLFAPNSDYSVSFTPLSGYGQFLIGYAPFPNSSNAVFWNDRENTNVLTGRTFSAGTRWVTLFVAVRAIYGANLTYSIVANQAPLNNPGRYPARLTNGVPTYDTLLESPQSTMWHYFVNYLPLPDSLTITIPRRLGDVDVFIKYQPFMPSNSTSAYIIPNDTNSDWQLTQHALDTLVIPQALPGRYIMAVRARQRTDYALIVTHGYTNTILLMDMPVTGRIDVVTNTTSNTAFGMQLYLVPISYVDSTNDLVFTVTQYSGHVVMYLSRSPFFDINNASTYIGMSEHIRLDQIVVPNALVQRGPYWLFVTASQNSTYSVSATYYTYHQVQMGLPHDAIVAANRSHIFHITVMGASVRGGVASSPAHDVLVSLTPLRGRAYMFIQNATAASNIPLPDPRDNSTFQYASTNDFSATQTVRIDNTQCQAVRCTYIILVRAMFWATFVII